MIIHNFTTIELNYFRSQCNFTNTELLIFNLRSQNLSLVEIAEYLNLTIDKVKKISRKINKKITKVL